MRAFTGYFGTYGGGIVPFTFEGGTITAKTPFPVENPSFLHFNKDTLLAVSETTSYLGGNGGSLLSLRAMGETLSLLSQEPTLGKDPCYVESLGNKVFVANYSEGTATVHDLENRAVSAPKKVLVHQGSGLDPNRQEQAHVHCTAATPDNRYIAVCDLGIDQVIFYTLEGEKKSVTPLPPGSGPRHILFCEDFSYVVTELTSRIFAYRYRAGALYYLEDYSMLPEDFTAFSNAAAIKPSPCGRFITASNRGHDSLAVFSRMADGCLKRLQIIPTKGQFPRDFAYSPDGQWLLAANQNSNTVTVFAVLEDGTLEITDSVCAVTKPVMILFTEQELER